MDLEKFEKEELPRMIENVHQAIVDGRYLIQAFEAAMAEIKHHKRMRKMITPDHNLALMQRDNERERCAKIAESRFYGDLGGGSEESEGWNLCAKNIAEEIRRGK